MILNWCPDFLPIKHDFRVYKKHFKRKIKFRNFDPVKVVLPLKKYFD